MSYASYDAYDVYDAYDAYDVEICQNTEYREVCQHTVYREVCQTEMEKVMQPVNLVDRKYLLRLWSDRKYLAKITLYFVDFCLHQTFLQEKKISVKR